MLVASPRFRNLNLQPRTTIPAGRHSHAARVTYSLNMRKRTTLAIFMAVLLLMLSFTASTCATECSLRPFQLSCHGTASSSAGQTLPAMHGMEMSSKQAGQGTYVLEATRCLHLCAPDTALASANGSAAQLVLDDYAATLPVSFLPVSADSIATPLKASPLPASSPVTLLTLLRV